MNESLQRLSHLCQLDCQMEALRQQLAELDEGNRLAERVRALEQKLNSLREQRSKKEASLRDQELRLASLEQKVAEVERKLYSGQVTNPKELKNLQTEVETLKRSGEQLEEKILILMEEVSQLAAHSQSTASELELVSSEYTLAAEHYERTRRNLANELAVLERVRRETAQSVDPQFLGSYTNIQNKRGNPVVAKVDGKLCSFCNMGLSDLVIKKVRAQETLVFCPNCTRILVL